MPSSDTTDPKHSAARAAKPALDLSSPAFAAGAAIPERHTADGEDVSPALAWGVPPPETQSLAIVCEDPDAPSGVFPHWLAWNIPPRERGLREDSSAVPRANGMRQGRNGFGGTGYSGPKPPPGSPHRYVFRLYALDSRLALPDGASRDDFQRAIDGHILAEGMLIGRYGRQAA